MNRARLLLLVLLAGLFAIGGAVLPVFTETSNCGGNSAALFQVRCIAVVALVGTLDTPDHSFRFTTANAHEREQLAFYARNHWVRNARFLVSTGPVFEHDTQPRRVIAVCDTPYDNVPRKRFGSAPPTHAAGFSDGSKGLISPAEFAALDRSTFIALDELFPPQSK